MREQTFQVPAVLRISDAGDAEVVLHLPDGPIEPSAPMRTDQRVGVTLHSRGGADVGADFVLAPSFMEAISTAQPCDAVEADLDDVAGHLSDLAGFDLAGELHGYVNLTAEEIELLAGVPLSGMQAFISETRAVR